MSDSDDSDHTFTAGDLRDLTGLSYRQMNEWDSRDGLPNARIGERGWRRMTLTQTLALSIVSNLKTNFGSAVATQRPLLQWMTGQTLTTFGLIGRRRAEDHLIQFTPEELTRISADFKNGVASGAIEAVELTEGEIEARGRAQSNRSSVNDPLYWPLVNSTVPVLVGRGWQEAAAIRYCELFFEMSGRTAGGENVLAEFLRLHSLATEAKDRAAREAAQILCSALTPLVSVLGGMSAGIGMYLLTDFDSHDFVDEFTLAEYARAGALRGGHVVLFVNEIANDVLAKARLPRLELKLTADTAERSPSEQEKEILRILRSRKFKKAVITPLTRGYQIVLEATATASDVKDVLRLVESHDFQTVVVQKHDGQVVHVTQHISHVIR